MLVACAVGLLLACARAARAPGRFEGTYYAADRNWLGGESAPAACPQELTFAGPAVPVNDSVLLDSTTVAVERIYELSRQVVRQGEIADYYVVSPNDWSVRGARCRSDNLLLAAGVTEVETAPVLRSALTAAELDAITDVTGVACALCARFVPPPRSAVSRATDVLCLWSLPLRAPVVVERSHIARGCPGRVWCPIVYG